jgi:nucleoside diphosphate kinase
MGWEEDAGKSQILTTSDSSDQAASLSYIMLKPDGNQPEVNQHLDVVFRQNRVMVERMTVLFSFREAFAFYPKDEAWCQRYGQKRLDALTQAGRLKDNETPSPLEMGYEILHNMAEYLSSGLCMLMVFQMRDAVRFGKKLAGATVPTEADPHTLRGAFSFDSIEASSLDRRALRNVVHAPDEENVADELADIFKLIKGVKRF